MAGVFPEKLTGVVLRPVTIISILYNIYEVAVFYKVHFSGELELYFYTLNSAFFAIILPENES